MSPPSKETWAIVSRGDSPRVIVPFKSKEEAETYYRDRNNLDGLPVAFVKTEALISIPSASDPAPGAFDPVSGAVTLPVPAPTPEKKPPGPAQ